MLFMSIGFLLFGCAGQEDINDSGKPNILFILVDDQHRDELNFLPEGKNEDGSLKNLSPNIDKLANEGVILSGLHCPSPVCVPSRFTYLTGMYASRATNRWMQDLHRIHKHTFVAQEPEVTTETPTLARDLKELGYVTGFYGKNHSVEQRKWQKLPADADVKTEESKKFLKEQHQLVVDAIKSVGFDYADRIYHTNPRAHGQLPISQHNLEWITEGVCDFIDENADKPFYLYYALTAPHGPKNGWKEDPKATPEGILEQAPDIGTDRSTILERLQANNIHKRKADILWMDDNIGVVIEKLEEKDILEKTIIVYVNDHGVESGKTTVYQGGLKTEGFIWAKSLTGGRKTLGLSSTVDLIPTLMDLAGGNLEDYEYDGVSLVPLLTGEKEQVRETVYAEMGQSRAVIKGRYKYIALRYSDYTQNMSLNERQAWHHAMVKYMNAINRPPFNNDIENGKFGHSGQIPGGWDNEWKAMDKYPAYFDADQLYDLEADPNEQNNLADLPEYQNVLNDLKAELQVYLNKLPGGFGEFKKDEFESLPQDSILFRAARLRTDVFH
jgi:arylsulfatase A-like enzyme